MADPGQAAAQAAPQYDLTLDDHQFLAEEGGGYTWEDVEFLEEEGGSVDPALRNLLELEAGESTAISEGMPTQADPGEDPGEQLMSMPQEPQRPEQLMSLDPGAMVTWGGDAESRIHVPEALPSFSQQPAAPPAPPEPTQPTQMGVAQDPRIAGYTQAPGLPPAGEPIWVTKMMENAKQQWVDFQDVPPSVRRQMLEVAADVTIAMRKKASANTMKRIKRDFGHLIFLNRGYGPKGLKSQLVDSNEMFLDAIKEGASKQEAEDIRLKAIERNRVIREGEVYEEPFRYESLDNFLAETWLKNPWLRGEEEGGVIPWFKAPLKTREIVYGLSRASFSARAHEKAVTEHKSTLEHIGFYLGFAPRYVQGLVAKGLGHDSMDAVLAAHMYGEHGKTGDAIASVVPEIVDEVKRGLWPVEEVKEDAQERMRAGQYREYRPQYKRRVLTADEDLALEKKAKMLVALAAEISIDPMWFVGFGATSATKAALGQVAKAARVGKAATLEGVKEAAKLAQIPWKQAKTIALQESKIINKKIMDEAREILSETGSLNEARKRIKIMLGKYAHPEAVKYIDEVVREAWGKQGLTFRIPFLVEGAPLPHWSPLSAESLASYRASMRLMNGLVRRGVIQKADALFDTGLLSKFGVKAGDAETFQQDVLFKVRETLAKSVIPNYRYSAGRKMDWAADDAASRLLDDLFGGAPIEAAGPMSREMKGLQTEIDDLYEQAQNIEGALKVPAPKKTTARQAAKRIEDLENKRSVIEADIAERKVMIERLVPAQKLAKFSDDIMQGKRMRLSRHLGNILLIENKPMRSSAIRRFRKRLLKEMGDDALIEFDPVLRTLDEGKWPEKMAERGHELAPVEALREARFDAVEAEQLLNSYASTLDASIRTIGIAGKPMAKELNRMVPEITIDPKTKKMTLTGKQIPERELAGRLLQTLGKDFMDLLPENILKTFPEEDLFRINQVVTFAADEFAVMAEDLMRQGVDMKLVDDYYPGIYKHLDNIIPDTGPMASKLGGGPVGMNPMMHKNLSSSQATAMGLKPERDVLKMVMARRLAHEQAIAHTKMIHEVLGTMPPKAHGMPMPANMLSVKGPDGKTVRFSLGREIDDLTEVARGEEAVLHWRKPEMKKGKWTGNWVEQDYAVSREIKDGLELAMHGLTNTSSPIGRQVASINAWFRGVLTSPNPGYHLRNAMSNTVLAWMAGVRDPSHYAHAFMATLAESSPAALKRVDDMIASLTKAGKTVEAENLSRFRRFRQWTNDQVAFELPNGQTITYGEFRTLAENNGVMNKGFSSVDLSAGLDAELKWASSPAGMRVLGFMGIGGAAKGAIPGAAVGAAVGAPGLGAAVGALGGALGPNSLLMRLGRNTGEFIENQARMAVFAQQIKSGVSPRVAAAHVDKYLYNYRNITEMEKGARQIFLFYTWMRKNMPRMVEELGTRPGRISAGTVKLQQVGSRVSAKDWEDARTEYRKRYYAKMGGIPLPGKTKGGLSMLALDLPWRDLNMLDLNAEDLMSQLQSMTTPILQVGVNAIAEALDKNLYGFGKGKTWVGNELVEAPGWLADYMPGEAMLPGQKKSGSGFKKQLGFEKRPDAILSAKFGKAVFKEYMPEHVGWWFNQIPMMAFASKFTGEDLTKEEMRAYQAMSYVFGWRTLLFDETASQEQNMFEVGEGVRREAPGRITTKRRKRSPAQDARITQMMLDYKKRKAAGELQPQVGGQWMTPTMEWPGGKAEWPETTEQIRSKALRAMQRGGK